MDRWSVLRDTLSMNVVQKGKNHNLTLEKYDRPSFNEMITDS